MPRDVNGNYTLPAGNPVATDTNIESTWANSTMQDIGAEITESLSRTGKGALTGPLQIIDEQTGVPGLAFGAEPTSGLKRSGTGDVRMQVQGTDRMRWRAGAAQVPEVQVSSVWKAVAVLEAARKVMQGVGGETAVWFYNATVPAAAGWELKVADTNLRNLSIAPGGAVPVGGGTIAGDVDPSAATLDVANVSVDLPANTGGHALTSAENGPHSHPYTRTNTTGVAVSLAASPIAIVSNQDNPQTGSSGSGTPHVHPLGGTASQTVGSGTAAFNPRRAMGILGMLSA